MNNQRFTQPPKVVSGDKDANQWAMFVHLSLFAGYLIPLAGLVVPIVLWQIKKDQYAFVDVHGKIVVNWIISMIIYAAVCTVLLAVAIGVLGFVILGVMSMILPIIGGIKANQGEVWEYPMSLKFIR
jgi:uncharacterized Tic20 family protein